MLFNKIIEIKSDVDDFKNSKNIFKRLFRYNTIRSLLKKIDSINSVRLDNDFLENFFTFANIIDSEKYEYNQYISQSVFICKNYNTGNKYNKDIKVILRNRDDEIQINMPIDGDIMIHKRYKKCITENGDEYTSDIIKSIRELIKDVLVLYIRR